MPPSAVTTSRNVGQNPIIITTGFGDINLRDAQAAPQLYGAHAIGHGRISHVV